MYATTTHRCALQQFIIIYIFSYLSLFSHLFYYCLKGRFAVICPMLSMQACVVARVSAFWGVNFPHISHFKF